MELSLIHDLGECIVGDLTPHCGVSPEEKHNRELKAMQELSSLAGSSGTHMFEIFQVLCLCLNLILLYPVHRNWLFTAIFSGNIYCVVTYFFL